MKTHLIFFLAIAAMAVACNRNVQNASQKFNNLPPTVQKTAYAQAPNAEIADVSHKNNEGIDLYVIEFREPGKNPKIEVAADGRLVSTDWPKPAGQEKLTPTGLAPTILSALPEAAQKTIQSKAPDVPIVGISRFKKSGQAAYEVEFKTPGTNSTLQVAQDGKVIQDLKAKELPPTPNAAYP